MTSLNALLQEVRSCTICSEHLPLGPRPVVQVHPQARILIAGQAPGRKVHESGVPFDDVSGKRLREWMGVTHEEFYDPKQVAFLPMGFCFPGTGTSGDLPPRPECAPAWREQLLRHLPRVELTLVLDGELEIELEGRTLRLARGDSIEVPPGALHQVQNRCEEVTSFLVMSALSTREDRRVPDVRS